MFPGLAGTTAIAGHRTTYLAPFRHIDELRKRRRDLADDALRRFIYTVRRTRVVAPNNVDAACTRSAARGSCSPPATPLFSAAQRILVFARLTGDVPLGAARAYERQQLTRSYPSSRLAGELGLPEQRAEGAI